MNQKQQRFIQIVQTFYQEHGRHTLPWRKTKNPYRILVSEIMLQQTQVDRVLPKYRAFLKQFPTVQKLSEASLSEVLIAWQGLGYNRRAKMLHQCAQRVVLEHKGRFPRNFEALKALPGIGPYTAGAVCAFAYNTAVPLIETNVRTVFIHHFFHDDFEVPDTEILRLIAVTIDQTHPRQWYWALMDYGSYLKKTVGNKNTQSKHYTKQSKFQGSDRQIRGALLRLLASKQECSRVKILKILSQFEDIRVDTQLEKLRHEKLIVQKRRSFSLPM